MGNNTKLLNKNFMIMVIGQIISLFGNAILRFALPLYLLEETGSAALFGLVSACSFIPMIILTPFGGIIADRVNKKYIMVALDFVTALVMVTFTIFIGKTNLVFLIIITLMILYGIQGAYQPSVQASLPFLVDKENLLKGNAIINQVSALANLIGPIIGGLLYGVYGLLPILIASIVCFILAVIMEMIMKIPYVKNESKSSMIAIVKDDIKTSVSFIIKEKPVLFKTIIIISLFNLFLTSMIIIGIPVIITTTLNMSSQAYGITQGVIALGGLCGGILIGLLFKNLKISTSYRILFWDILALIPMGLTLMFEMPVNISYVVITVCCFFIMTISTVFSIQMITFIQGETPGNLIGKVISICLAIGMCAQPIGQVFYGYVFEVLKNDISLIIFGAFLAGGIIVIISKKVFSKLEDCEKISIEQV
ncbi:Sugar phosphate permease [Clostridium collagenovorans DSM 3089]|uniref:Sugar phosphate permease n=1 Tax=Clostridium collagenovorans DSM 3089 TaxID=1121306 RepID=A0A1M5X7D6_9CLOT|nr:MFS transporter [Clostridium collagenovorans]SHH95747.1 Sugar phosphate permease [Clostridium collagenovorans DSM 3089]